MLHTSAAPVSRDGSQIAFVATLLLPWMMIFFRGGAEMCCGLIGVLFLVRSWRTKDWQWLRDPIIVVCFIAWLWLLLAVSPLAHNPPPSFKTSLFWIRLPVLYAALRYWVLVPRERLFQMGWNMAAMFTFIIVDTGWQYATGTSLTGYPRQGVERMTGPFGKFVVGIFTAKLFLPCLGIWFAYARDRGAKAKWIFGGMALACVTLTIISGERTAFGGMAFGLAAMTLAVLLADRKLGMRCLGVLAGIAVLCTVLYFTQHWVYSRAVHLYRTLLVYETTPYGRLVEAGYRIGKDHWATGVGIKSFRTFCPEQMVEPVDCNIHPHNPYIEWFAETGLPGLLIFFGLIFALTRDALRHLKRLQGSDLILPAVAIGVLVANFFPFMVTQSFFSNWPAILLWLALGLAYAALNLARSQDSKAVVLPASA